MPARNLFYKEHYKKDSYDMLKYEFELSDHEKLRIKKSHESANLIWENTVLKNPRFFLKVYPLRTREKMVEIKKLHIWQNRANLKYDINNLAQYLYGTKFRKKVCFSHWSYLSQMKHMLYYLIRNKNIYKIIRKYRKNINFCQSLTNKHYTRWRGWRIFRKRRKFASLWKKRFLLNSNVETNKWILAHTIISKEFFTLQKFVHLKPHMFTLKINKFIKHFFN
jgi:hypothetical protein